jgi:beta-galactosidase
MKSRVWVNGHHLGRHPYGYTSFYYDITPYLCKGDNVIAVRVDNSLVPSARWYTGSGIYRHVWLIITNKVHIPIWGAYVTTPIASAKQAKVKVKTEVKNGRGEPAVVTLETRIRNKKGTIIASTHSTRNLDSNQAHSFEQTLQVHHPHRWSPAHPATYMVESIVRTNGKTVDTYKTRIGIRSFSLSADSGFVLNGQPMEIQGVAMHSGGGGAVGAAVPDDILYYRLKLLKKMGANAIRTAHNPQSPEFYTICDTLGLMILDELFDGWRKPKAPFDYGLYFKKWWKQDAIGFIRRDRNHPSVIMWSIGNEVGGYAREQQKALAGLFHQMDPPRPVTQARAHDTTNIDIPSFNGGEKKRGL